MPEPELTAEDIEKLYGMDSDGDADDAHDINIDTDDSDSDDDGGADGADRGRTSKPPQSDDKELSDKARAYDELARHLEADPVFTVRTFIQKLGLSQEDLFGETKHNIENDYDVEDMTENEKKLYGEIQSLKETLKQVVGVVDTVKEIKGAVSSNIESRQARVRIKTELGVDVPEAEIDRLKEKHGVNDGLKAYKLETWGAPRRNTAPPNTPALKDKVVRVEHLNKYDLSPKDIKKLIEEGATIELPETLAAKYGSRYVKRK